MQRNRKLNFSLKQKILVEKPIASYELRVLNKMQTRKLPFLHKVAIDLLLEQVDLERVDYIVSSSQHGELNISDDLITDLIQGRSLSPTKFSQSTHNALVGNLGILSNKKIPMTAISAREKSFSMGFLSAVSALHYEATCVLYLYTEAAPPERYQNVVSTDNIIVALLLERGDDFSLTLQEDKLSKIPSIENESEIFANWTYHSNLILGNLVLQKNDEDIEKN